VYVDPKAIMAKTQYSKDTFTKSFLNSIEIIVLKLFCLERCDTMKDLMLERSHAFFTCYVI